MIMPKLLPLLLAVLTIAPLSGALAQEFHQADVAAINKILETNDAANGVLKARGWRINQPNSWPANENASLGSGPSLFWTEGRLTGLSLNQAALTGQMDMSGLDELRMLSAAGNDLSTVKGLSGLTRLETLVLTDNQLVEIGDLGNLTRLTTLRLSNNRLTKIGDLSRLANLEKLWLSRNQLTNVGDLSRLTRLKHLLVNDNRLKNIGDLSQLKELAWLDISNNSFTTPLSFGQFSKLKTLSIAGNKFTDYSFISRWPASLQVFSYSGEQMPTLTLNPEHWADVKHIHLVGSDQLEFLDLNNLKIYNLSLSNQVKPGQVKNPAPETIVTILQNGGYTLKELLELRKSFKGVRGFKVFNQSPAIDDLKTEIQSNAAYNIRDISPTILTDFNRAGNNAFIVALTKPVVSETALVRPERPNESDCCSIVGNTLTFKTPGEYYLGIIAPELFENPMAIIYKNKIKVVNP